MSTPPFRVKAVFEYKSEEPDDLSFPNGQIITVTAEEDDDWYSGEYASAAGDKVQGIFPRNFVEKYEPAVPSRPARTQKRPPPESDETNRAPEPTPSVTVPAEPKPERTEEAKIDSSQPVRSSIQESIPISPAAQPTSTSKGTPQPPPSATSKPATSKSPPPTAEKPTGNSFRDRIAAFNKPAAAPVAPFKPGGQASSGFIKKPFVAPPPSKNAYVPPPREQAPQKVHRREEEQDQDQPRDVEQQDMVQPAAEAAPEEEQTKPTSLKDRIALLQKQQLEQAARHAESAQKKEKPKKPPKRRTESSEKAEQTSAPAEPTLERVDTNETIGKKSVDFADDEAGPLRGHRRRQSGHASISTPPPPSRELVSDTNDADDSGAGDTEDALETSAEEERAYKKLGQPAPEPLLQSREATSVTHGESGEEEKSEEDEEAEDEEEEEDPEVRRRRELRDRMAKMSGGMGMMGMFGPPGVPSGAPPRKPKPVSETDRNVSNYQDQESTIATAPPVPIMALPGMSNMRQPKAEVPPETESDEEDTAQHTPEESATQEQSSDEQDIRLPPKRTSTERSVPPVPSERAVPPQPPPRDTRAPPPGPPSERPVPATPQAPQSRAVPPPPTSAARPLTPEEDSGDEMPPSSPAVENRPQSKDGPPALRTVPPVPSSRPPERSETLTSSPTSPSSASKRVIRAPPPLPPISPTTTSPQVRAPPPPPPGQPPTRRMTSDSQTGMTASKTPPEDESEGEVTEYDGDYDTDIASSAKHKDALKSHNRDSSLEDGLLTDEHTPASPPPRAMPPVPGAVAPRDIPPPPPSSVPKSRKSLDAPRAAPPPVPPTKEGSEEDYDPYRYSAPQHGISSPQNKSSTFSPVLHSPQEELEEDDMYSAPPPAPRSMPPLPGDRAPPGQSSMQVPMSYGEPSRPSSEIKRSNTQSRRSMEQSRPSGEQGFMASDIDLAPSSMWWTKESTPPPALQGRPDVLCEFETSTSTKRGGRSTISRDVYVLYMDYSQSTINASFDSTEPLHATLEQSHDRPPMPLRQDQLEEASTRFGARISEAAAAKSNASVGDGSPHAFVLELIQPLAGALKPVGIRAYGALVYANLANASTQQFDEIRPGDIVTFRNAKFAGHKGGLHSKYAMDVGKPDHVGVVLDWDGTKKKIRAWEQGREGKKGKVNQESFRVGDLKSGEVRVWRVMGRRWVGWDK